MNEPIIELCHVSRSFAGGAVRALDDVSMVVNAGQSVAFTGPSGSGKSTLLNIIGTLDFATSGQVRIKDRLISPKQNWDSFRNTTIGFVFQLFHLVPELSLAENVELALRPQALTRQERRERAEYVLSKVGLGSRLSSLPTSVSGGERQRTAIARALVTNPEIVLADEPTGNLDSKSGGAILDVLQELTTNTGKTLLLVTHNLDFASRMDRLVELCDGKYLDRTHQPVA